MRNGIPNKSERRTMQLEAHYKHLEAIRDEIWVSLHGQSSPHNHPACEVKHMNSPGKRLSTRLLAIERDANRYWTAVCNGTQAHNGERVYSESGVCINAFEPSEDAQDRKTEQITVAVQNILGGLPEGFTVNRDPRGYCLKIDASALKVHYSHINIHRDMGGYGIMAPEITGE